MTADEYYADYHNTDAYEQERQREERIDRLWEAEEEGSRRRWHTNNSSIITMMVFNRC